MVDKPIKIYVVFLASPSDLQEERKIAQKVVEEVNKTFSDFNIKLFRWEKDRRPGYKRPQDLINKENYDLFVGLLWKKWGTKTGSYSSGFEEEYERAKKLRKKNKIKDIWLYFKEIDKNSLNDPGKELKKVIAFRKQLENDEKNFFAFKNAKQWEPLFRIQLSKYFMDLHKPSKHKVHTKYHYAKKDLWSTIISLAESDFYKQPLRKLINFLPFREREIIKLHYGIGAGYFYTIKEIGKIFKISPNKVRQIERQAKGRIFSLFPMKVFKTFKA